jgi:hypothetical protein
MHLFCLSTNNSCIVQSYKHKLPEKGKESFQLTRLVTREEPNPLEESLMATPGTYLKQVIMLQIKHTPYCSIIMLE